MSTLTTLRNRPSRAVRLRYDSRIGDSEPNYGKKGSRDRMNPIDVGLSAMALATALLSTSSFAESPGAGASKKDPSAQKQVTFHVIGLMKTQSGAT